MRDLPDMKDRFFSKENMPEERMRLRSSHRALFFSEIDKKLPKMFPLMIQCLPVLTNIL